MRIHLSTINIEDSSYHNVKTPQELNQYDTGECTEIVVDDFLQKFPFSDIGNVIRVIVSKLSVGGKIVFYHNDVETLCHLVARGELKIDELNELLFSGPVMSLITVENLKDLLIQNNITITKILNQNNKWIIEGKR